MAHKDAQPGAKERAATRRRAAVEYRKYGLPYRAIAERLGVSPKQAWSDVQTCLKEFREQTKESTEDLVQIERESLDMAAVAIAAKVAKGELGAIDRWIKLSDARRSLLGLDAPKKQALTTADGRDVGQPVLDRRRLRKLSYEQLNQLEELLALMNTGPEQGDAEDNADDE